MSEVERVTKNLLMRAWRERWTHVQWGIHAKQVSDNQNVMAECILQQALIGPGPNTLVLSYLVHSVFSQVVSTASVLRSVSKYDGYHKPFCITSLLELLDTLKERLVVGPDCLELAMSIQGTIHWLLACMYSSLENLSDLTNSGDSLQSLPVPTTEDSRIVSKCRKLIEFLHTDPYVSALVQVANAGDAVTLEKIRKMCKEVGKFSEGLHKEDIAQVTRFIGVHSLFSPSVLTSNTVEATVNRAIQATVMNAALLKSSSDLSDIVADLLAIKEIKNMEYADLICDLIHSTMIGQIDALGTESEVRFLGFTFLQLPSLLGMLNEHINDSSDLLNGICMFISNESCLDMVDAKLHAGECSTLELFLSALARNGLLTNEQKSTILQRKGGNSSNNTSTIQPKPNSSNAMLILKAETTLLSVLKTLDGDYSKNQDAILGVLSEMFRAKSFELILTASSATGRLEQVTSRLLKLNQASRMVTGEGNKASATRALIFDISFLSLCYIVQHFGMKSLDFDTSNSFFTEWAKECMVEGTTAKSPERILARCDQNKVDLLLNTYLQTGAGDAPELKTSLVFWHELTTNAVGLVRELLLAWESAAISFNEVKRILDTMRSKVCSVPVSVAAWLCSHIQIMREEDCGKARYILNHFLTPVSTSEDNVDNFKERCTMMNLVINKMMVSIQSSSPALISTQLCIFETCPTSDLLGPCWTSLGKKGLLDVETTLGLSRILELSPPTLLVQLAVEELLGCQQSQDLTQLKDLVYGILHFDLDHCAYALFRSVLPNLLLFSTKLDFAEPQLTALVSLSVEIALSLHFHTSKLAVTEETYEPSAKKMKLATNDQLNSSKAVNPLTHLYQTFGTVLARRSQECRPQGIFILRFLEQLAARNPSLITLLPHITVFHLLRLLGNEISPSLLPNLFSLENTKARRACADAISFLKNNASETGAH